MAQEQTLMDKIVSLCKRRGFIYPSSEIYGGINGCWDFGHLGVELRRNIKDDWWKSMVRNRRDVVGIDSAIIMNPEVWKASGHLKNFTDPLVDCKICKGRFRADQLDQLACPQKPSLTVRSCAVDKKGKGELTESRQFNMMLKTFLGASEESANVAYLRPETAQGIFVNFKNSYAAARQKPPFGIAQIGKSFRNEINPRNFIFRSREFEQMEMEFFTPPDESHKWYEYWRGARFQWHKDLGIREGKLRLREHEKEELAHYAKGCADVEYEFPFGWQELEGIANRGDYDLKCHAEASGKELSFFDEESKAKFVPHVIEPALGVDRCLLAVLCDAYDEEGEGQDQRVVLRLHPKIAPVTAAIFPLVKKDGMPEVARNIEEDLRSRFSVFYDESGAVGRRYRRQDEVGTPFCLTVDNETLQNGSVTLRLRDSMAQERLQMDQIAAALDKHTREYKRP